MRARNVILLVLVLLFAVLVLGIVRVVRLPSHALLVLGIAFAVLGAALTVLTVRLPETGTRKAFFIATGAAAAGIPVFAILHNVVYGLFILWFGDDFWQRHGMPDEPVFFVLAVLVCPAVFVIGATAGGILLLLSKIKRNPPEPLQPSLSDANDRQR